MLRIAIVCSELEIFADTAKVAEFELGVDRMSCVLDKDNFGEDFWENSNIKKGCLLFSEDDKIAR